MSDDAAGAVAAAEDRAAVFALAHDGEEQLLGLRGQIVRRGERVLLVEGQLEGDAAHDAAGVELGAHAAAVLAAGHRALVVVVGLAEREIARGDEIALADLLHHREEQVEDIAHLAADALPVLRRAADAVLHRAGDGLHLREEPAHRGRQGGGVRHGVVRVRQRDLARHGVDRDAREIVRGLPRGGAEQLAHRAHGLGGQAAHVVQLSRERRAQRADRP